MYMYLYVHVCIFNINLAYNTLRNSKTIKLSPIAYCWIMSRSISVDEKSYI